MLIDHLVYKAADLAGAVAEVEELLGVRARAGGQHIGLGTHNALLALGPHTYLEIIAPDPGQPAPSAPRPLSLDGVRRSGLVGWAIACHDIHAAVAKARRRGYDPGEVASMQRATPTGAVLRWRLTLGAVAGGLLPFLISWGDTEHPDPASLAPLLDALGADAELRPAAAPALIARLSGPNGSTVLH